jgi:alanine dehydrogenase
MNPPVASGDPLGGSGEERKAKSPVLFLDRTAVEAHLSPALCLEAVEGAFRSLLEGQALQPLRTLLSLPGGRDHFLVMPAHVGKPAALGAKLLTLFPGNHDRGLPSHQGVVLLFDVDTGGLRAVVDAESVTSLRTAAASALATRLLAREEASDLAILGAGVQARSHLDALLAVRPIRRVRVWSRTADHARAFVAEARARLEARARVEDPPGDSMPAGQAGHREGWPPLREIEIAVAPDPESAVRGADVICTVTASPTPILKGEWIAPGSHVNAVGAYTRDTRELDTLAIRQARFYVDRRESAMAEAGDFLIPRAEGAVDEAHILGELGELLEGGADGGRGGRVEGRTSPADRTVFKSLGLAVQDLAAVAALVREIEAGEDTGTGPAPPPSTSTSTFPPVPPATGR